MLSTVLKAPKANVALEGAAAIVVIPAVEPLGNVVVLAVAVAALLPRVPSTKFGLFAAAELVVGVNVVVALPVESVTLVVGDNVPFPLLTT